MLSPHLTAAENVPAPAEILVGLTAMGPATLTMQRDWPDGTVGLEAVRLKTFPLAELPAAIGAAARMRDLDATIVTVGG